ncbi:MAG: HAD hydrolase-like protein [Methanobacterium sp.]|nr:HAD hydrolase-like protein [Methanobacterium sp.]
MVHDGILALFDIDGTLVRGARCHYQAFVESVKKYYGFEEDISGINYAGKTDPQILREALELGGFKEEEIEENFNNCLKFMVQYYIKNVHKENVRALGGTFELLDGLKREETLLGLVTGNLEPIAYAKLGRVGLDKYFPFGGFGSDYAERSLLVKKALNLARDQYEYDGDRIFVIGDTPRDVEAAQAYKLTTIAVATGRYSEWELENCGADHVLKDLNDKEKVLKILDTEF